MAISYKSAAVSLGRKYGLVGRVRSIGRKLAPLRGLIIVVFFHFIVSLGYITLFAWRFSFGRRLISLHLSIVISLVALMMLGLGGALLFRRFREWKWAKVFLALVPAIWLSVLVILYFADYIGN